MTWSPFFTEVTPAPISTTTPAPSCPRIDGNRPSGSAPDKVNSSVWQTPVALISTRTSPARGPSSLTVSMVRGAPALCAISRDPATAATVASRRGGSYRRLRGGAGDEVAVRRQQVGQRAAQALGL